MRRTKLFCAVICMLLLGGVVSAIDYGISCPDHLYVKSVFGMSNEQQVLLQSLQGIVAQTKPEIFIEAPGNALWLNDLESAYGVTHEDRNDLAWYLNYFSSHYNGYLLYDYTDLTSLNVASALAGLRKAVAVDVTLESWVQSLGLTLNEDVRTRDEQWLYNNYWGFFRHDLIIANNGPYMHDLAPAINGFSSYSSDAVFADTLYNSLETETPLYFGWIDPALGSHDESLQVTYHSEYGFDTTGAGLNYNYSTYAGMASKSPEIELKQPTSDNEYSPEENVHYVTFYMSDMGNLAFLPSADGWAKNVNHYGHPRRGEFGMGWGTSQLAVDFMPNIMDWWYRNATENDSFVASSYIFPTDHPNLDAYTKQLDEDMKQADLGVLWLYDDLRDETWNFESIEYEPYLRKFAEMHSFRGGIYAEYFPYYAYDGRVKWVDGKPFVNIKYVMDEANDDGLSLASKINTLPTDVHDEASYSMVLVNAWGFGGVLMPQVCDAVDNFDSDVRVVTPREFFERLHMNMPYSSKASSSSQFNTPEEKCYDGSGMTGDAHNNNYSDMWLSGADDSTGWIKFNLGDTYQLDLIEVWNYNQNGETRRGVNEADIYWSNSMSEPDGGGTFNADNWNLKETKFFTQAPGTNDYNTPDSIDMDGIRARWIAVDIKSHFGDSGYNDVGLSEVKFYGLKDYSVKASSRSQFTTPEIKCYDDSGMTGDAHNNSYPDMWLSGTNDSTGWIKFNLGSTYGLDEIKVWNYNQDIWTIRGVNEADIYWSNYSTDPDNGGDFDPNNWTFKETKFFTQAPGTIGYNTPDSIDMAGIIAKWVAIDIKSNFGDSGFNDVGLSEVRFVIDSDAPTPNPATFATVPYATGTDSIIMVATTGSDVSGPVEYLFVETSGNPGGSSSSWQTSTSYSDTGLDPSTQYTYTVTMRDATGKTGTASSPASATTLASLVVHLPLHESTGTTAGDSSSYNNNGTVMNTTFDAASVTGQIGNALLFDGIDDYVNIPDNASLNPTDKVTVSAWIKADTWQTYHWGGSIVSKDATGSGYILRCGENGRLSFAICTSGWAEVVSSSVMSTGTWYHVAGTYDGATMKVYINGSEVASNPASNAITSNTHPLSVGRGTYFKDRIFDGAIDDVAVWRSAMTPSEINFVYVQGLVGNSFTSTSNGTPYTWLIGLGYTSDWELADLEDLDNDGFLNWQEYTADTNPNDDLDFLKIEMSEGLLNFDSSSARRYAIKYCDNLLSGNWQILTNNILGSGSMISISPSYTNQTRYYKVSVERVPE